MTAQLSADQRQLMEGKNFAHLATVNPDGSPQVTPVWIEMDGDTIVVNSEKKRKKVKNMEREPRVALSVADAANPYKYVEIRGRVLEITEKGAFEGIDRLAKKYIGQDKYPWNKPDDVRVIIRIDPEKVSGMG
jgi:PPOX class probable F420-dependent enzyme